MIFLFLAALYGGEERVARLEVLLEVTRRTPHEVLAHAYEQVSLAERGACAAGNQRIRSECLFAAARSYCDKQGEKRADCLAYQDVIVSNVLAEQQWVPPSRRYEIMAETKHWRREMAREIRRLHAALAADLRLRTKGSLEATPVLARSIDAYCSSSVFETGLSWQICASSLVWFVGAKNAAEEAK